MRTREANDILMRDLKLVADDAEELLKATVGEAGETVKQVRTRLLAAIESARTTCDQLQAQTADAARTADQVLRGHVYESIGAAFGLGLLIGVLVGRQ